VYPATTTFEVVLVAVMLEVVDDAVVTVLDIVVAVLVSVVIEVVLVKVMLTTLDDEVLELLVPVFVSE